MISSASTLLLVTLVFNAASVFGAPVRIADTASEVAARAEISIPVQPVARAAIVDVEDHRRRSELGTVSRRAARLVTEREEPFSEGVAAREPVDIPAAVEEARELRQRRYPRRILHDLYEKREPEPEPVPAVEEITPLVTRYPRRILHDFYQKREPATSVKETTLVTTKVTVFDTPADATAFGISQAGAGGDAAKIGASASSISISIPIPSVPAVVGGVGGDGASTIVSLSSTTTIASPDASATATGAAAAASATVTSAPAAEPTAASSASSTGASSAAAASPTGTTADATSATTSTTTGDDKTAGDDKTGGDGKTGEDQPAPATPAATPDSAEPTVDGTTEVPASTEARRWVKASSQPILRRMAVSGASMASAVRRQLMNPE